MDIYNLQQNWEEFGKSDPLWSILTWEGKKITSGIQMNFSSTVSGISQEFKLKYRRSNHIP
jgi:hypothetical protein